LIRVIRGNPCPGFASFSSSQASEPGYQEVIRFDSAHDCPHKDILGADGKVKRKVWFELLDNKQGLDLAIKDLKDNYELYIERYLKWQKKSD
jgi:hypothetical protein